MPIHLSLSLMRIWLNYLSMKYLILWGALLRILLPMKVLFQRKQKHIQWYTKKNNSCMERPKGLKGIPAQRRATFLLFPVNKKEKKNVRRGRQGGGRGGRKKGVLQTGALAVWVSTERWSKRLNLGLRERRIQSFLWFTLKCRQPSFTPLIHELWWEKSIVGRKKKTCFRALITQHFSVNVTNTKALGLLYVR